MKRILFLFALILAFTGNISAQLSNYGFSASGGTYTAITGTVAPLDYVDNGHTGLIPIGFTFVYEGQNYSAIDASSNGMAKLGAVITSHTDVAFLRTLQNNGERPIIAPLWDDMMMSSLNDIRYETSGSAPNKIFTLQWAQVKWPYVNPNASIEFQVRLYEGTNKIEFIYNQLPGTNFSAGAVIGISALATGSGNYWSLQSTGTSPTVSSTSQAILSTKPAQGQIYAFQPLSACSTPLSAGTTVSSAAIVCNSTNFSLTVNGASQALGLSYQWQSSNDNNNWQDIPGGTALNLSTSQTVSTYYRRSITCGASTSYSSTVQVSQMTAPSVSTSAATTFCDGGNVQLTSSASTGNQWYNYGVAITGAINPTYNASTSGDYTVISTAGSCISPASAPVAVTVKPNPTQATVTASGATTFCQGGSVILNSSTPSGNQWSLNGTAINGATSSSYNVTQSGNYNVTVTNNGCSSPASTTTVVTVNAVPATPSITVNMNAFSSSASTGNQWYKDGVAVPGATSQSYLAFAFGSYSVKVTTNGCSSVMSNAVGYIPAGLNSPSLEQRIIITNPVKDHLEIQYKGGNAKFDVLVSDLYGRIIARSAFSSSCKLNINGFSAGSYVVQIVNQRNGDRLQKLIVKN